MSVIVEIISHEESKPKLRVLCACGRLYVTSQDPWNVRRARYCIMCAPNPRHMQLGKA